MKSTVHVNEVVYTNRSLFKNQRRKCAPAYSIGILNEETKHLDMTIHLTPEAMNRPAVRKALIQHETREGYLIASGKPIEKAHVETCRKDPQYSHRGNGWWDRLGHEGEIIICNIKEK